MVFICKFLVCFGQTKQRGTIFFDFSLCTDNKHRELINVQLFLISLYALIKIVYFPICQDNL